MKNQIALVTYATKYAGPGIVSALLQADFTVICHDTEFTNEATKFNFEKAYPGIITTDNKTPGALVAGIIKQFGCIDLLVSNDVYPLQYLRIEETEANDVREASEALLVWPFCLLGKVAAEMKQQQKGYIILLTSAASKRSETGFSIYSSIRAAASTLAQAAGRELAPYNIIVNAIAPNYLESETYYPPNLWTTTEAMGKLRNSVPLGRLGKSEEIGALIAFLASGAANFITGEVINFTGGWP